MHAYTSSFNLSRRKCAFREEKGLADRMEELVSRYGLQACMQSLQRFNSTSRNATSTGSTPHQQQQEREQQHEHQQKRRRIKKDEGGFTPNDFLPFNQLKHPVWIFDFENKSMWWANTAAVELWNAEDLTQLLARDFTDMSQATAQRLESYLPNLRKGGCESEQWTIHPNGVPTTLNVNISGIYCSAAAAPAESEEKEDDCDDQGVEDTPPTPPRMLMLKEGDIPRPKEELDHRSLRRVEILRHLPLAVAQFDNQGKLMEQNPEASAAFGGTNSTGPSLVDRFVTTSQGQEFLKEILNSQQHCHFEAPMKTTTPAGAAPPAADSSSMPSSTTTSTTTATTTRWFALKAICRKDPVTSQNVILLSAQDVTAMRQAKMEADQADREKSEFLAVMAHEIRTPLHQVIGFGELLGQTTLTSQQREYVQFLESSSKSLMTVINDTLDYTKLEAGEMKVENIKFEVQEVLAGVAYAISPKTKSKGLALIHQASKEVPNVVSGDPTRLRQILLNLTHNAFKFTDKGSITLDVQRLADGISPTCSNDDGGSNGNGNSNSSNSCYWLRFEVRDTGVGIASDDLPKLFRKYQQASAETARKYGGTGLGLAICDLLVKAMQGRMGVTSVLGKGTTFWLELPFERVECTKSTVYEVGDMSGVGRLGPLGLNVLVVEDNRINQKLAGSMLKRMGHTCTVACHGLEALQKIEQAEYDLVLMDVQMPVMDGLTATKKLRREMNFDPSALPIIGLTADFRNADLPKYVDDIGMNDCIGKPVRFAQLKVAIQSVLEKIETSTTTSSLAEKYPPDQENERRIPKVCEVSS